MVYTQRLMRWLALVPLLAGCPALTVDLDGRPCDADGDCVRPYACVDGVCVLTGCSDEICDGLDNDCDDQVDEDFPTELAYEDADDDGHGAAGSEGRVVCIGLLGVARTDDDCDDTDPNVYAGALDTVGDGIDQSCDGADGVDGDGDGVASEASGGSDCDDAVATCAADCITDADGDGNVDCADPCIDADGDGYGEPGAGVPSTCTGADCDDLHATCAADCVTDQDGDGTEDCRDDCVDADEDGYGRAGTGCAHDGTDCDDTAGNTRDPDGDNVCNGSDNCEQIANGAQADSDADCPALPYTSDPVCGDTCDPCNDADRDGYGWAVVSPATCVDVDCDDSDGGRHPGAVEICDGVDNDCDLRVDEDLWSEDADLDGVCDARDLCWAVFDDDRHDRDGDCPDGLYTTDPACGDACDDSDGDGVVDRSDNCRAVANPDQKDTDDEGFLEVLAQTFDADIAGWRAVGGSWRHDSGTLQQTSNEGQNFAIRDGFELPDDFVYWSSVYPADDDTGGLAFGYQDSNNFYAATFSLNEEADGRHVTFELRRTLDGAAELLASSDVTGAGIAESYWYSIGVIKQGDRATFLFDWNRNGRWEIVGGADIGMLPGRSIGAVAIVEEGIRFDDLTVAKLGATDAAGDACDLCPAVLDPEQADCDGDGAGDACDAEPDSDADQVADACDVCWSIADPTQADSDATCAPPAYTVDPMCGDACTDLDGDGVNDAVDNCREVANAGQADSESAATTANTLAGGHPPAWLLIGPWDSSDCSDRGSIYREWLAVQPISAGLEAGGRRWRRAESATGSYDWTSVFGDWVGRRGDLDGAHGYAVVWFFVPTDQLVYLLLGADDAARVSIDGTKVVDKVSCGALAADQVAAGSTVTAGWHQLMVRVTNQTGAWGHALRFADVDGVGLSLATSTEPPFGDGVGDACDGCPAVFDPEQRDQDGDGIGDRCDRCGIHPTGVEPDSNTNCPPLPFLGDPRCGDTCE